MIDTSKYEGHTPGPWEAELDDTDGHMYVAIAEGDEKREVFLDLPCWVCEEDMLELTATAELIADAPLILAEVKRLRERLIRAYDWAENAVNGNDSAMMDYIEYVCGDEGEEE